MAEYKGIMVFCETADSRLAAIGSELLGGGKRLAAELGEELIAVIIGSGVSGLASQTISLGANKVYVVDNPAFKYYENDSYVTVMKKIAGQVSPRVIMIGHTAIGRDMTPRLAFKLNTAASLDCVELAFDAQSKRLLQTKPVYGGKAYAVFVTQTMPEVVTVRAKSMNPAQPDSSLKGQITSIPIPLETSKMRTNIVRKVVEELEGVKLEDAAVVVSGGRGIGSAEGFKQLEELARLLHGAVGASRPACDNGWVPTQLLVGLTGKIVGPELYIAVAISGSSQHMSGCSGSKNIVSINKDSEAAIVGLSRYAVIGDWKKVLPAFTAKVRELMAE